MRTDQVITMTGTGYHLIGSQQMISLAAAALELLVIPASEIDRSQDDDFQSLHDVFALTSYDDPHVPVVLLRQMPEIPKLVQFMDLTPPTSRAGCRYPHPYCRRRPKCRSPPLS